MAERDFDSIADEYLAARRRGRACSIEELARRHPAHAGQLRELLPVLERLEAAGDEVETQLPPPPVHGELGDYRIERELGRGGMGVVYLARQRSLDRLVALKILSRGARLDPQQIERFRREARAAARLRTVGIVPVYEVGELDGLPFYAMQWIDGVGLDVVLDALRASDGDPSLRREVRHPIPALARELAEGLRAGGTARPPGVRQATPTSDSNSRSGGNGSSTTLRSLRFHESIAGLFLQAARALAYAHDEGVLHRDVKPSNLLVDREGAIWLTDFGLAKTEGTTAITHSGDILGTPRYLAPESLRGWSDTRTDVWGLGISLYEALTLRPAFDGESKAELLRRIAAEDPPAPRRVDPRIPTDLETIVLHAIDRDPERRYPSAEALALDLERYLDGKPVLARRAPWSHRAGLFLRRHRVGVAMSVAALIVFAAMSVFWVVRLSRSVEREQEAARIAREQSALADENFRYALEAVERMQVSLGAERLVAVPGFEEVRRAALEDAQAFYRRFLGQRGDDRGLQREAARAWSRLGWLELSFDELEKAEASLREAERMLASLLGTSQEDRAELALVLVQLGRTLQEAMRFDEAEDCIERGLALFDELSIEERHDPALIGATLLTLGASGELLLRTHRPEQAAERYARAVDLGERLVEELSSEPAGTGELRLRLGQAHTGFGRSCRALARYEEAEEALLEARGVLGSLSKSAREDPLVRWTLAQVDLELGNCYSRVRLGGDAEANLRSAMARFDSLAADFPAFGQFESSRAEVRVYLGLHLQQDGRFDEAESLLEEAIDRFDAIVRGEDTVFDRRRQLAVAWISLGNLRWNGQRYPECRAAFENAVELLDDLRTRNENFARSEEAMGSLALALGNLGNVLYREQRPREAEEHLIESLELFSGLHERSPDHVDHVEQLLLVAGNLARGLRGAGRSAEVEEAIAGWLDLGDEWLERFPASVILRERLASLLRISGNSYKDLDRLAEAESELRRELDVWSELTEAVDPSPHWLSLEAGARNDLAMILARLGRHAEAVDFLRSAIESQARALEMRPGEPAFHHHMAMHHLNLSWSLEKLGARAEGAEAVSGAAEHARFHPSILVQAAQQLTHCAAPLPSDEFAPHARRAIEWLGRALEAGVLARPALRANEALAPLRSFPEFEALLEG